MKNTHGAESDPTERTPPSRTLPGAVAVSIAAVLWGLDGVVLTPRLVGIDILVVVFLLHAVPFLLMQPFLWRSYRVVAALRTADVGVLLGVSLLGGVLGTYAIVQALFAVDFHQLSVVVLLQKLQPVFAIALAATLLGERVGPRFLARAGFALFGAYLLTFGLRGPEMGAGERTLEGALWALVAAASFGAATVLGKRLLERLDPGAATFGRYGATTLLVGAFLLATGRLDLSGPTSAQWGLIALIGVTTGSGSLFLYYRGLQQVRAITAAVCELWLPVSAVLFDRWFNGSELAPSQWVGGLVLVAAITLVSLDSARRQASPR